MYKMYFFFVTVKTNSYEMNPPILHPLHGGDWEAEYQMSARQRQVSYLSHHMSIPSGYSQHLLQVFRGNQTTCD